MTRLSFDKTFIEDYFKHLKAVGTGSEVLIAMRKYIDSPEFAEDVNDFQNGTYSFSIPEKKELSFRKLNKTRNIWFFSEREINFQRLIFYALHAYDCKFSSCIQCGLEKTTHWELTLRKIKNYDKLYFYTTDIHKCSDSIDRDILLEKLADFIDDDPPLLEYLNDFVRSREEIQDDNLCNDRCAVPAGSPLSWFFVNLYLRELDQSIETKADFYARLTDRIIIGCFDPEKLRELERKAKAKNIRQFIDCISSAENLPMDFSEFLWNGIIDHVTVNADETLDFVFINGQTIREVL